MSEFLKKHNPFYINTVLINLNSDEVGDESVNVFQTQAIGASLIQVIVGISAFNFNYRKKTWPLS